MYSHIIINQQHCNEEKVLKTGKRILTYLEADRLSLYASLEPTAEYAFPCMALIGLLLLDMGAYADRTSTCYLLLLGLIPVWLMFSFMGVSVLEALLF